MDTRSTGSARPAAPAAAEAGIAPLFAHAHELGALERMLLAWAVHPSGVAFARARLYLWSAGRSALIGRLAWTRDADPGELGATLARAARHAGDGPDSEDTRRLRTLTILTEHLGEVGGRAWSGESVAVGPDAMPGPANDPPPAADPADLVRCGAVRLMRDGRAFALIAGEWAEPGDGAARLAALAELRRVGEVALRMEQDRVEGRRRARQVAALAEFAHAGVSPLNLAEVLSLATRLAVETGEARGAALWLGAAGQTPELQTTQGPLGARERLGRALGAVAAGVIEHGRPRIIDRMADEPGLGPDLTAQLHSLIVVPLGAYGVASGALALYDRVSTHPAETVAFDRGDVEFVTALADLVGLAVDSARRCESLRQAEQRHHDLQRQLARRERLAALGEMAARVAHEVRNPLASIGAFARRAHRQLAAEDPGREYLDIVIRETERLERMVGEQLQYATLERPRLKLEGINNVVQDALQAAGERLVRRRVRLLKRLSPDLPPLLLDTERIGKVVSNILDHALDAVSPGGRLRVESRRAGAYAVVEIAHDGQRHPGELLEQLFVPFAVSRQGGPGVGLAVAQQVLKQHGGEIRVRGEGEWSSVFSFTLPIPDNEDRRRVVRDRRLPRTDRRTRAASG